MLTVDSKKNKGKNSDRSRTFDIFFKGKGNENLTDGNKKSQTTEHKATRVAKRSQNFI